MAAWIADDAPTSAITALLRVRHSFTNPIDPPEQSMKNRLTEELRDLDLAIARLGDRRTDVINMLETLATLIALEPRVGQHMDQILSDRPPAQIE
jgi:hypothetical protein